MSKLTLIDSTQFILEGAFEKIRTAESVHLDEESIIKTIEKFKKSKVDQGVALGELNDGFLVLPVIIEQDGEQKEVEQIVDLQKEPAFMIVDIWWESEKQSIFGKIIILDTEDGQKIKESINQNAECFISATETEVYTVMNKSDGKMYCRISDIKGYKISIFNF